MRDFSEDLRALRRRLDEAGQYLDIETSRKRLADIEPELSRPDLWDSPEVAQRVTREYAALKEDVDLLGSLESRLSDAEVLYELAREESDSSVEGELEGMVAGLSFVARRPGAALPLRRRARRGRRRGRDPRQGWRDRRPGLG